MSYWVELHCDRQREVPARCHTVRGNIIGTRIWVDLRKARKLLSREAKFKGWTKSPIGWLCPECSKDQA